MSNRDIYILETDISKVNPKNLKKINKWIVKILYIIELITTTD